MRKIKKTVILSLLILTSLIYSYSASKQCEWTGVEKIVAVGDIHGDYKNFVKILKGTGMVDENLHWTGGKTHLVQTGDIMDRGPDAKKAFDLLMRLEIEAEKAGGKVHILIGNHEEMNITGIAPGQVGYVTPEQFVSFLPEKYRAKKEKEFKKKRGGNAFKEMEADSSMDINLKKYWEEVIRYDKKAQIKYTNTFNEKYGKWIIKHNAVIKINDIVFVHGGISEKFSTWKLKDINDRARYELNSLRLAILRFRQPQIQLEIVYQTDGPFWFRGLAQSDEELFKEDVSRILRYLNANYIVMAHTPQRGSKTISEEYMSRFQGRIWIIDTGISDYYGGNLSALIINNRKFSVWGEKNEKKDNPGHWALFLFPFWRMVPN